MLIKCTKCHHEWQSTEHGDLITTDGVSHQYGPWTCDWCGAPGRKIAHDYMEGGGIWMKMLKTAIRSALVEWYSGRGEGVSGTELDRVTDRILNALQEAVKHGKEK